MDNAEIQDSNAEVVAPEAEIQQETQQLSSKAQETSDDSEWIKNLRRDRKEFQRRAEQAEREAQMQRELNQQLMSQRQGFQQAVQQPEEDILQELARAEYVPGETVVKALRKQKEEFKRDLDEVKQTYASQRQQSLYTDLKRKYPDFEDVVNSETLSLLEETDPELASSIASSKDPYHIAVQSYKYIKASGLSSKLQPSKRAQEVDKKIEQNKKTVQSPQVFDKRPIATAFQLTEDMKKDLQKEMYHYAQQAGMGY